MLSVLELQREFWHPKMAPKVSGLSRNGHCKLKLTINANQVKCWLLRREETGVPGENRVYYCDRFATIPSSLTRQRCGRLSGTKQMWTGLNLGEKMEIYPQAITFSLEPQIWSFRVVVLLTTAKKWTKTKNTRAERAKLLLLLTKYANLWRSRCRRRCGY